MCASVAGTSTPVVHHVVEDVVMTVVETATVQTTGDTPVAALVVG